MQRSAEKHLERLAFARQIVETIANRIGVEMPHKVCGVGQWILLRVNYHEFIMG